MSDEADDEFRDDPDPTPPDASLTAEMFQQWRSPRRGEGNPERMGNPIWEWLIRSRWNAYQIAKHFDAPSACEVGPGWCFDRFGQSSTLLPDGRTILIAGEHEDHYDPDFYIYNDLVVRHPDGRIDIFGYSPEIFPPTDFHSATLVGDSVILIGNLGYPEQRQAGVTPVFVVSLRDFSISPFSSDGPNPGWVHQHTAQLTDDGETILIQRGMLDRGPGSGPLVENIDDWCLNLKERRWQRLTERRWIRMSLTREDGQRNHLWQIRNLLFDQEMGWKADLERKLQEFVAQSGYTPQFGSVPALYDPKIPHEKMAKGDYRTTRIRVDGVVVRYVDDGHDIQMIIEGELPKRTVEALATDLQEKLARLENAPCVWQEL